ncbi:MAG: SIS domain-containing protein [Lentisphaeria bacterium]|nr:SIS domain-containing protein [Victivallales bacterium]MCR4573378.1 SIS domain-containing protein [Lentisphaeria bacterium]
MKNEDVLQNLFNHYPELQVCESDILKAFDFLADCYDHDGIVYTCGNGGSCADAAHIVGELMKGFVCKRPLPSEEKIRLRQMDAVDGDYLANHLQRGLRAISLMGQESLSSAVGNDLGGDLPPAQQLIGFARPCDVLWGISTSGNARNIALACKVAKLKRLKIIGMTGEGGGTLATLADVCIRVPSKDTYRVQEYHLPIYHALCMMIEYRYFDE